MAAAGNMTIQHVGVTAQEDSRPSDQIIARRAPRRTEWGVAGYPYAPVLSSGSTSTILSSPDGSSTVVVVPTASWLSIASATAQ